MGENRHRPHHCRQHHRHHHCYPHCHPHRHPYLDTVGEVHLGARPRSEVDRLALRHQHCLVDVHLDGDGGDQDDDDDGDVEVGDVSDLPLGATAASTAGENVPPRARRASALRPATLDHAEIAKVFQFKLPPQTCGR